MEKKLKKNQKPNLQITKTKTKTSININQLTPSFSIETSMSSSSSNNNNNKNNNSNNTPAINLQAELLEFQNSKYPTIQETIINNASILYKRKKFFLTELRESIQFLECFLIILIYLRDLSFFKLLIRSTIHLSIININPPLRLQIQYSDDSKKSLIKISLRGLIIGNLFCLLTHLIFGIYQESPNYDGYLHGGITIQFIGERLPYSRFELIILDIMVFFVQLLFHNLVGVIVDSEVLQVTPIQTESNNDSSLGVDEQLDGTFGMDRVHIEQDGYNGNVYLLTIDILGNIKKVLDYQINFQPPGRSELEANQAQMPGAFPGANFAL
ncbi:conserved hypothetical protein [Candida dubliniensis CD36]|uniref:DUF1746 domain-containing protein n=1 Tax=Candida dubliniensis (strain CD36 / ATCC MYA-646 / CBS 7987 / NCPF 3949 / NRRL Y-17841) TaxID=573826 RepID=B9WBJ2_CANDC|nr:conserved hypothetical protein [Candida dubliniensis CD36]CAX43763.1 conserved hypothetical protein [Candida dubliniensis CD36]